MGHRRSRRGGGCPGFEGPRAGCGSSIICCHGSRSPRSRCSASPSSFSWRCGSCPAASRICPRPARDARAEGHRARPIWPRSADCGAIREMAEFGPHRRLRDVAGDPCLDRRRDRRRAPTTLQLAAMSGIMALGSACRSGSPRPSPAPGGGRASPAAWSAPSAPAFPISCSERCWCSSSPHGQWALPSAVSSRCWSIPGLTSGP